MLTKTRLMQIIKEEVAQAMGPVEDEENAAEDMFADMEDASDETDKGEPVPAEPEEPVVPLPTPASGEDEEDEEVETDVGEESGVDHEAIADTTAVASKMLSSLEDFEENATPDMQNAISTELAKVKETLLDMVMNPGKFAKRRNLEPKTK